LSGISDIFTPAELYKRRFTSVPPSMISFPFGFFLNNVVTTFSILGISTPGIVSIALVLRIISKFISFLLT
jgi:hypothetical protein